MIAHRIKKILENEQFDCSNHHPDDLSDDLIVDLGNDKLERERILEISCRPLQFSVHGVTAQQTDHSFNIQFIVRLPYKVQDLAATQLSSLLHFINHNIDWPGFDFDEVNNKVAYRYIWITKDSAVDAPLLMNIVASVILCLDLFGETIEEVALGHATFDEVLQKITQFKPGV